VGENSLSSSYILILIVAKEGIHLPMLSTRKILQTSESLESFLVHYYLYAAARDTLPYAAVIIMRMSLFPFSWKCSTMTRGDKSQATAGGRDEEGD
jgi:uncharacterized membrane protein